MFVTKHFIYLFVCMYAELRQHYNTTGKNMIGR